MMNFIFARNRKVVHDVCQNKLFISFLHNYNTRCVFILWILYYIKIIIAETKILYYLHFLSYWLGA